VDTGASDKARRWPRRSVVLVLFGALLVVTSVALFVIRPTEQAAQSGTDGANPVGTTDPAQPADPSLSAPATSAPATPSASATAKPSASKTAKPATTATTRVYAGYPSAGSTGWKHTGVTLTAYKGSTNITTAGAVIDGKDLGCVNIQAANVTIKRSRVTCSDLFPLRVMTNANVTVEDTEIDGGGSPDNTCLTSGKYVARRVDCHGVGDGMYVFGDSVTIEDSYIHDLVSCGGCHNDGIQVTGGNAVVIRHNTIENKFSQTSCVKIGDDQGPLRDVLVESNLFNGGGYALYAGGSGSGVSNMRFINNHFAKTFFPGSGSFGPVAYYVASVPGNVWSGNVWDDNGTAVNPA
jgi:hypothetical protein